MDINKIAKRMTRGEFLNNIALDQDGDIVNIKNCNINKEYDFDYCPDENGLDVNKNCYDYKNCKECWKNAIKDIKFKGEDCMEFNWNEFKKGEIVIHCDTKEKAINFLSECNLQNIKWMDQENIIPIKCYFEKYETGICYRFVPFESNEYCYGLTYDCLEFYETIDCEIIEWEIKNKIDYDREYIIEEIMEFENGTVFADIKYPDSTVTIKYDIDNGCKILINNDTNSPCKITDIWLNTKFKLVKKDKKVSFKEAMQAYDEYKIIKCIWEEEVYKFNGNKESRLIDIKEEGNLLGLILNGEWYIKED
ncbi:hypothetical protein [Clostridium botulinum]|uniref:hypothetical protein n=1 Tax=Clostridium botulinum TaxID=1491 RepID=UPI000A16EFEF|nr:hypothetical protein [Clostridium botulinum]OSA81318.1 hypothetical protein B2H89_03495 [Clostridium botulinum]